MRTKFELLALQFLPFLFLKYLIHFRCLHPLPSASFGGESMLVLEYQPRHQVQGLLSLMLHSCYRLFSAYYVVYFTVKLFLSMFY